ncbi:hypothetical protein [Roseovarius atlanticus]|nr:hypothetical protein [Roseovarius atlanticus]
MTALNDRERVIRELEEQEYITRKVINDAKNTDEDKPVSDLTHRYIDSLQ